jgi:hypothetical protein
MSPAVLYPAYLPRIVPKRKTTPGVPIDLLNATSAQYHEKLVLENRDSPKIKKRHFLTFSQTAPNRQSTPSQFHISQCHCQIPMHFQIQINPGFLSPQFPPRRCHSVTCSPFVNPNFLSFQSLTSFLPQPFLASTFFFIHSQFQSPA